MFLQGATVFEVTALWITLLVAVLGLVYAYFLKKYVMKQDDGNKEMKEISKAIQDGAETYLRRQLRTVFFVIVILAIALFLQAAENRMLTDSDTLVSNSVFSRAHNRQRIETLT